MQQSGGERPSYDELAALVARLAVENAEKDELIGQLRVEVAELKRQLGQNSRNFSRPPSSDSPFVKPALKSLRRKSGKKRGGQEGHPGSTLAFVDNPAKRRRHEPGPCVECGADLADVSRWGCSAARSSTYRR